VVTISVKAVLNAIEGGDIEAIRQHGLLKILIDLKPVLIVFESPRPQIRKSIGGNTITVLSGDVPVATVQADSADDAEQIASVLADLLDG